MQNQEDKQKEMPLHERLQQKRLVFLYERLKDKYFKDEEALLLTSLFGAITTMIREDPKKEPTHCHVFCSEISSLMTKLSSCSEIASLMTEPSGKRVFSEEDVQKITQTLNESKKHYKYTAINREDNFGGLTITYHYVKLIHKDIGLSF